MIGMVDQTGGGSYRVRLEDGLVVEASLRGRLKLGGVRKDRVVIGDRVSLERLGDGWAIDSVEQRTTELVRRSRGKRVHKVLAANLDRAFMVVAAKDPQANPELVDRLLLLGEASRIKPTFWGLIRVDLPGAGEIAEPLKNLYQSIGYLALPVSAETGVGLGRLKEELCSGVSTLIGPSGVGKSSLLNAIEPQLELRTGELSRKGGTGRHTTVNARIIPLDCGGFVADTPGFGDIAFAGIPPSELGHCFPEFSEHLSLCRFRGCSHVSEPDCGIKAAVDRGVIPATRFRSYLKAHTEAVDLNSPG
ncbi:MAG: putative ribosome biogenesis GTPase RsgA [Gemmatimonadota bacterium]|nr:MAG: putative ribosome biogenesis GTPase RsgA [Gemmatimonadota bacterium]